MNGSGISANRKRAALTAMALMGCMLIVACSPAARFRVLNFFFDGVPPPPGMEAHAEPSSRQDERVISTFAQGLRTLGDQPRRTIPAAMIISVHEPYAERKCSQCHDMSMGVYDMARDASLCDRCHIDQRKDEGWDHGPINLGTCIPCHVPHQSVHEHLLDSPVPDLCFSCHAEVESAVPEYHDVPNFPDCVACHDPHRMY